jgi:hypothetical protein
MLVFATSDKGGTGRSVTSCNVVFRRALQGSDVCYLDFDFGSPTAGAIFEVVSAFTGTAYGGLHSYLQGRVAEPTRIDVWAESERDAARHRPSGAGDLVLIPGDQGGGEFAVSRDAVRRCAELFLRLDSEFDVVLVDLSAGRSYAVEIALEATALPELSATQARWVVYHRWTIQHILATSGFVYGDRGLLKAGKACGHDEAELRDAIRFVRTAVIDPESPDLAYMREAQAVWLRDCNRKLQERASSRGLGRSTLLHQTPLDPLLQWREQLISDDDVARHIANPATVEAFKRIATLLTEDTAWEGL